MENQTTPGVPSQLGRYEVVGLLATGGMAEILLGRIRGPSGFRRPVVIKRILPHLARVSAFREMFLDEARLVARINHENVVKVHELGTEGGELFLVMEYLEGESVGGLIRRLAARGEMLEPWLGAHVAAEACAGLHMAHELADDTGKPLELVHRDVSPQNLFITYSGTAKLLDFGIAKVRDRRGTKTATGQIKGKFQYMSPEQCQGEVLDRRSDIFSLGVVLFELTTGRKLFKGRNELLTFQEICQGQISFPSRVLPGYPAPLEPIVLRALARDREDRYQTAADMRHDLLAAIREIDDTRDPREELSRTMSREFSDRVGDKREMLRTVGGGRAPLRLPPAEVDETVEVPAVVDVASTLHVVRPQESNVRGRPGAGRWRWAALGAAVAAGAGLFVLARSGRPLEGPLATSTGIATNPAPAASATLRIASTPAGAAVMVNDRARGKTPNSLVVPRGQTVKVVVKLPDHEPITREFLVEGSQTLDLALRPKPTSEPPTKSKPPPPSPPPARTAPRSASRSVGKKPHPVASAAEVSVPKW